jgi:hypothetical protein
MQCSTIRIQFRKPKVRVGPKRFRSSESGDAWKFMLSLSISESCKSSTYWLATVHLVVVSCVPVLVDAVP